MTTSENIVRLSDTDLSMDEILDTVASPFYSISIYDPDTAAPPGGVASENLASLKREHHIFCTAGRRPISLCVSESAGFLYSDDAACG